MEFITTDTRQVLINETFNKVDSKNLKSIADIKKLICEICEAYNFGDEYSININDIELRINIDESGLAESPLEWADTDGAKIVSYKRNCIFNEITIDNETYHARDTEPEYLQEILEKNGYMCFTLNHYTHGDTTLYIAEIDKGIHSQERWDYGYYGILAIPKKTILEMGMGKKYITQEVLTRYKGILKTWLHAFNAWINGYIFEISLHYKDGDYIESNFSYDNLKSDLESILLSQIDIKKGA